MPGIQESQKSESAQSVNQHIGIGQKKCTKCGKPKLLSEFNKRKEINDGHSSWCKKCTRKKDQKWRAANPEKVKENNQSWYQANLEKAKEDARRRYWANPEKAKEMSRNWKQANPEKIKEKDQKWRQVNSEKHAATQRNRKARKKNVGGTHTDADVKKIFSQQGGQCNACGKKLIRYNKKQYHVDHIVPLFKGGSNGPENLQLLCPRCNLSKNKKDPIEWARENGRLF
jgi:5-methylcytosine-specific restriction endonuclease McrA